MVEVVGDVPRHVLPLDVHLGQLPMGTGASGGCGALVPADGQGHVLHELLACLMEIGDRQACVRVAGIGVLLQSVFHQDLSAFILLSSAAASGSPCLAAMLRKRLAFMLLLGTYFPS